MRRSATQLKKNNQTTPLQWHAFVAYPRVHNSQFKNVVLLFNGEIQTMPAVYSRFANRLKHGGKSAQITPPPSCRSPTLQRPIRYFSLSPSLSLPLSLTQGIGKSARIFPSASPLVLLQSAYAFLKSSHFPLVQVHHVFLPLSPYACRGTVSLQSEVHTCIKEDETMNSPSQKRPDSRMNSVCSFIARLTPQNSTGFFPVGHFNLSHISRFARDL